MNKKCTEESFLNCVKNHQLTILKDDGVYRHIRFKDPDQGSNQYFDLITWPGNICYTGDMGTYTFARIEDMFEFFDVISINPGYWKEKVTSEDMQSKCVEYSPNKAEEYIRSIASEYVIDNHITDELLTEFNDEIQNQLLNSCEYLEDLIESINNFYYEHEDDEGDLVEVDKDKLFSVDINYEFDDYTHHYLWACYAIVWGINKYKEQK